MAKLKKIVLTADDLPKYQREAVLDLIDMAMEENMEKVLAKFDSFETKLDSFEKQLKLLLWLMGLGFTGLGLLITIISFLK